MLGKIKKLTDIVLIAGFLGFIYLVLVMTYTGSVQKAVEGTRFTFESYEGLSKKFEGILQKNLYKKYGFINLNGRIMRVLRINSLNNVNKMANGFLTWSGRVKNIDENAERVIELSRFLMKKDTPFLYILVPQKNSMYDAQFNEGYVDESHKNIRNMINRLETAGVNFLDTETWFKENGWHTEDIFFKTDHHWKPKGALAIARRTMELLQQKEIVQYDESKLMDENYNIKVFRNWFLGSQGKRVGKYYTGVDDIAVYYPKFKTGYYYAGLKSKTTNWFYSDSILDLKYLKKKDYFGTNPYCIYLYGDYPLQIITNTEGYNAKRLLIVGDSIRLPWQYFITTQFQEVFSVDLRHYTDGTFAQYVGEIRPDIVIMCTSESGIDEEVRYTFGVKEYLTALSESPEPIQALGDMEIMAGEKNNNRFEVVCDGLEPNQTYMLTVDNTELYGAKKSYVQMTLQNISANKAIYNRYFEANNNKKQKWIFTTPEKIEDTYGIYLYAGAKGHTANIGVKVEGIKLRKGIFEK